MRYKSKPGIYKLTIKGPLKSYTYIGQSIKINKRLNQHKVKLKKGVHYNTYMQNAYNKYQNIDIKVMYCNNIELLTILEQTYINIEQCSYNVCLNQMRAERNQSGWTMKEETKKKISSSLKGNPQKAFKAHVVDKNHHNYDHTQYTFINIFSKEIFKGTRKDFMHKINMHWDKCNQITELITVPNRVCYSWMLGFNIPQMSDDVWVKKCKNIIFIFENNFECFKGTMKEFKDQYKLNKQFDGSIFRQIIEKTLEHEWKIRPLEM